MKLRYSQGLPIIFFSIALAMIALTIILFRDGLEYRPQIFMCIFLPIIGYLHLTRTYFEVSENELIILALTGKKNKSYQFSSLSNVNIRNNKIYILKDEKEIKVDVQKSKVRKSDWLLLETFIIDKSLKSKKIS